jgi:hypothetical protein
MWSLPRQKQEKYLHQHTQALSWDLVEALHGSPGGTLHLLTQVDQVGKAVCRRVWAVSHTLRDDFAQGDLQGSGGAVMCMSVQLEDHSYLQRKMHDVSSIS